MKYKTLFRLLVKIIGVYFVTQGLLHLIPQVVMMIQQVFDDRSPGIFARFWRYGRALIEIILGLYLFFGGKWIVNKAIPSNRHYCHECAYELRNLTSNRCPECGTFTQTTQDTNKATDTAIEK